MIKDLASLVSIDVNQFILLIQYMYDCFDVLILPSNTFPSSDLQIQFSGPGTSKTVTLN